MTEAFNYNANYTDGRQPSRSASITQTHARPRRLGIMLAAYQRQDTPGLAMHNTMVDGVTPGECETMSTSRDHYPGTTFTQSGQNVLPPHLSCPVEKVQQHCNYANHF